MKLRSSDGARLLTLTTPDAATGLAFDGANIWIANPHQHSVTKLRARDGVKLGSFNVGLSPGLGLAFDGANIWVSNSFDNTITKLRASDGANLGTFPTGVTPSGVAFDGENVWVANTGSNSLTKLRTATVPISARFLPDRRHASWPLMA